MYVRWLGAFRKSGTLEESLTFEFSRKNEVACEKIDNRGRSAIPFARVGLLIDPKAVLKHFKFDVWSEYREDGTLYSTRHSFDGKGIESSHKEAWAMPVYTGIVLKECSLQNLRHKSRKVIEDFARENGITIYKLTSGKLVKIM